MKNLKKLIVGALAGVVAIAVVAGTFLVSLAMALLPLVAVSTVVWAVYNYGFAPIFHLPPLNYFLSLGCTYLIFVLAGLGKAK